MTTKNIVWLASYPKSGNTWVRVFLANYLANGSQPVSINQIHRIGIGDSITKAYRIAAKGAPFDPADHRATVALRGRVLRAIVANKADVNFVKTHCIRAKALGVDLIPPALTRSGVYILRNPLDVVVSYARHYGLTPEATVRAIARSDNAAAGGGESVPQFLGNWSDHVRSWTRTRDFPVLTLRYEDMLADPTTAFGRLLAHVGLSQEPTRLARAIEFSRFDELRAQEARTPFVERSANQDRFFHTGAAGQWQDVLPPALVERIGADHGEVMRAHGYLP